MVHFFVFYKERGKAFDLVTPCIVEDRRAERVVCNVLCESCLLSFVSQGLFLRVRLSVKKACFRLRFKTVSRLKLARFVWNGRVQGFNNKFDRKPVLGFLSCKSRSSHHSRDSRR